MPKVLQPLQRITDGVMTGTTALTSGIVDGRYLTNLKWQISWTGTPVGTFSLQESLDYNPANATGNWLDNGAGIAAAAGASGSALVNLINRAPCFYRLVYTNTSGTGVLNAYASGSGPL